MSDQAAALVLGRPVHTAGGEKPFGSLTVDDVRTRASELAAAGGWGPTARVVPVARAWSELARAMDDAGATTVGELPAGVAAELGRRAWVVPPGGSLL